MKRRSICQQCFYQYRVKQQTRSLKMFITRAFHHAQNSSKRHGIALNITKDYLLEMLEDQKGLCYYTNIVMESIPGEWAISIDRMDSKKGYIKGNVVLCCWRINRMKCDLNNEQFIKLCKMVSNHAQ